LGFLSLGFFWELILRFGISTFIRFRWTDVPVFGRILDGSLGKSTLKNPRDSAFFASRTSISARVYGVWTDKKCKIHCIYRGLDGWTDKTQLCAPTPLSSMVLLSEEDHFVDRLCRSSLSFILVGRLCRSALYPSRPRLPAVAFWDLSLCDFFGFCDL